MTDRTQLRPWATAVVVLLALAAGACKPKQEPQPAPPPAPAPETTAPEPAPPPATTGAAVQVSEIRLGTAVGDDKMVSSPAESFAPTDTVYASVTTTGESPSTTLRALWTFQDGQSVADDTRTVVSSGTTTTEFHISQPSGLPSGTYKVEIFVDGASAGTKSFQVR